MKYLLPITLVGLFSCGTTIRPETPPQREAREKEEHVWAKSVSSRYDLDALLAFLRRTAKETKSWQGVDLTRPKIGAEWAVLPRFLNSGDWFFVTSNPEKEDFDLKFYDSPNLRWIVLKCAREEMKSFRLVEILTKKVVL